MNLLALPAMAGAAYYLLAIVAAARFRRRPAAKPRPAPQPVSILKPVHGRDPRFYEALVSHARQDYPEFEILFGVSDPADAALEDIARLQREFPTCAISVSVIKTAAPNAKVGVLAQLAKHARYPLLVVNDSDIKVGPRYLHEITAPLSDPLVGLVTCLYRAHAETWAVRAEALGIATEFAPSVLVACLLGQGGFALGSTMVFRAATLRAAGGFEAIAAYLADDYQLGLRISRLGLRIEFSREVVETGLSGTTLADVWRHQLRWSRTIRVSRPGGYYGYVVTHATLWALVAFAAGQPWAGGLALAMRLAAGMYVGAAVLHDRRALTAFWMMPLRDLFGFFVWVAGAFGASVVWRGEHLRLRPDGTLDANPHRVW